MAKIIAIFTQKGALSKGIQENTKINLFQIDNDEVSGVETLKPENTEPNYISLLMALKNVSLIYIESINKDLKNVLEMIGIKTKCKEEMTDDLFINQFIFE